MALTLTLIMSIVPDTHAHGRHLDILDSIESQSTDTNVPTVTDKSENGDKGRTDRCEPRLSRNGLKDLNSSAPSKDRIYV